jgi:hypothetical protein
MARRDERNELLKGAVFIANLPSTWRAEELRDFLSAYHAQQWSVLSCEVRVNA